MEQEYTSLLPCTVDVTASRTADIFSFGGSFYRTKELKLFGDSGRDGSSALSMPFDVGGILAYVTGLLKLLSSCYFKYYKFLDD